MSEPETDYLADNGTLKPEDWPEDFVHENGRYLNVCLVCLKDFLGHKKRPACRVCSTPESVRREFEGLKTELETLKETTRICRKFGVSEDDPAFETARSLDRNRPDTSISDLPSVQCPHCAGEYELVHSEIVTLREGATLVCKLCDHRNHVDRVETVTEITLCTHPMPKKENA